MSLPLLVVVTGMSGAGRSTVLDALEDIGYYCVDNLPPQVIQSVVTTCLEGGVLRIALGLDVRVRDFL
ncbi:MAG TPA: RNase adapter RapZ, partial [Polyangiaceae bacterium]|nr:RNase adapter RapZ [Polyangiaceae bacterium]